jgi:hypothetical protein
MLYYNYVFLWTLPFYIRGTILVKDAKSRPTVWRQNRSREIIWYWFKTNFMLSALILMVQTESVFHICIICCNCLLTNMWTNTVINNSLHVTRFKRYLRRVLGLLWGWQIPPCRDKFWEWSASICKRRGGSIKHYDGTTTSHSYRRLHTTF